MGQRRRGLFNFGWGFIDQGLSSAVTLGLTILAGRRLGPEGLGVVVIGFWAYWIALGFQRALLTTPHVAATAAMVPDDRERETGSALSVCLAGGVAATGILLLGGLLPGALGTGILLFAPWIAASLLQDFWRAILFRDMSGRAAAVNDAIWVMVTAVLVIPAWIVGTETAIVACWGGGAVAAAIAGFVQTRRRPARLLVSLRWWRVATWPFARWLAGAQSLSLTASALTVVALTAILGPEALGGLRAAQSLFAPMTLLGPAIGLPGLPALTRALGVSSRAALAMATRLSAVVVAITGLYVALMAVVGPALIPLLFGKSFSQFEDLWLPTGVWQLLGGVGLGFGLLLTAKQRGRDLISARLVESLAGFGFIVMLSWRSGLNGAAWGYACGAAVGSMVLTWYAVASREEGVNNPANW